MNQVRPQVPNKYSDATVPQRNQLRLFATEHDQIEKFKNNLTAGMLFRIRHYGYDMHGLVLTAHTWLPAQYS